MIFACYEYKTNAWRFLTDDKVLTFKILFYTQKFSSTEPLILVLMFTQITNCSYLGNWLKKSPNESFLNARIQLNSCKLSELSCVVEVCSSSSSLTSIFLIFVFDSNPNC